LREEYDAIQGRFSPDMTHMAYLSNEINSQTLEVYVRHLMRVSLRRYAG